MQSNAASAAICAICGAEINKFCAKHSTGRTRSFGSTIQPTRQPVIEKYFENEFTTTAPAMLAAVESGAS